MSLTLIVGDIHLGKGLSIGKPGIGSSLNSRIKDQMALLDWIVDLAIDNHVRSIILTGDICEDAKPDYVLLEIFFDFLKKLEAHNIECEIIAGNHDIKRTGSHYKSFLDLITSADIPGIRVHKYINTVFIDNVGFTLMPFRDRRSLSCKTDIDAFKKLKELLTYEVESIPSNYHSVLIGHLAIKGSIFVGDEFDNEINELMCPIDVFQGYEYVWMGHVHKPQVCSRKPYIAHIGSLDISDFGETDHKKVVVLFDSSSPSNFTEIEVPSRPLRRISIDVPEGFIPTNYVIDQINALNKKQTFKKAIVKVEINLLDEDAENIDREKVEKAIYNCGAYYICNLSESRNTFVMPLANKYNIDNKIDTKAAIKIWADHIDDNFEDQEEKKAFIDLGNKFADAYQEKYN